MSIGQESRYFAKKITPYKQLVGYEINSRCMQFDELFYGSTIFRL